VKGVVVLALPYLGRITEAFPPPYNYILVAAILALVFALELRPKRGIENAEEGESSPPPGESAAPGSGPGSGSEP
jgi:hypothetical protein